MKLRSNPLKVAMIAALALTGAAVQTTPSFASGTASASCVGTVTITAVRPAGPVTLPPAGADGYSPWTTDYFTMHLDSRHRFIIQCYTLASSGNFVPEWRDVDVAVRCADHSNVVRARRAPHGVEFQCYAHDHRQ